MIIIDFLRMFDKGENGMLDAFIVIGYECFS